MAYGKEEIPDEQHTEFAYCTSCGARGPSRWLTESCTSVIGFNSHEEREDWITRFRNYSGKLDAMHKIHGTDSYARARRRRLDTC